MVHLIAHRGASSLKPENTIASIQHAIDLGVDYVEIDVHFTKDLVPVVIHDPTTTRTSGNLDFVIAETDSSELNEIDVGSWFHQEYAKEYMPFLKEVLRLDFKNSKLMIEIKNSVFAVPEIVRVLLNCLKDKAPSCILGSFDVDIVKEVQRQQSDLPTIGIISELDELAAFLEGTTSHMAIDHEKINAEVVAFLQAKNIAVWTFTVDDHDQCRDLLALQLDGIITNKSHAFMPLFK